MLKLFVSTDVGLYLQHWYSYSEGDVDSLDITQSERVSGRSVICPTGIRKLYSTNV
jgi:hypothetical protein